VPPTAPSTALPPPVTVLCQLDADDGRVLARRRAQDPRQRRAVRRWQGGWLAAVLVGVVLQIVVLHSHRFAYSRTVLSGVLGIGIMGVASLWLRAGRQRRARLRQWPTMRITISQHGLTIQDGRSANRLAWADIGPIPAHRHGLEFHDHYGNLLAYLPNRLLDDDQRHQVLSLVQAAGRLVTPVPER